MDKTRLISIAVILGVICILSVVAYNWHQNSLEAAIREEKSHAEGEITVLKTQLIKSHIQTAHMKHIADSAIASIHLQDTIYVREKNGKAIYTVRNLSPSAGVLYLSNRLSKDH